MPSAKPGASTKRRQQPGQRAALRLGPKALGLSGRALLCLALLGVCAATSLYFAPLWYGLPMVPDEQSVRVKLLDTWIDPHKGIRGWFGL